MNFRPCWADRLAVLWAFVVVLVTGVCLFELHLDPRNAAGDMIPSFVLIDGLLVAVVWIFLRLLDWVLGGPERRRLTGP
jgi:hypothetical protein